MKYFQWWIKVLGYKYFLKAQKAENFVFSEILTCKIWRSNFSFFGQKS